MVADRVLAMNSKPLHLLFAGLLALTSSASLLAQEKSGDDKKKNSSIKPYDEIITKEAKSQFGLFRAHELDGKLFYEILPDKLDKDFLWVSQVSETTAGYSYSGMPVGNLVVRWEKRGEKILLRKVNFRIRAETEDSISLGVEKTNLSPILKTFDIQAYGKDLANVIEVTDLFKQDLPELSAKDSLNVGGMDSGKTFIDTVKVFPDNIMVKALASFKPESGNDSSSGITAVISHSMIRLPEIPMQPRFHDSRVGFFTVGYTDFADDSDHDTPYKRLITRWRLEKKDPKAEVSEPVKPIVFYVGRETPDKWKPYVKAGIEQWAPAFEAAGFKNAVIGKLPPSAEEDPNWDPEDARVSSVRWLPSDIENAFGPHVHDPRTGEILEADIRMYHNVQKLVRDWYFVQASPNDPRAQKLPMPDDLMGELIQFVVAHEVGHSLGFPHNMKASSAYTVEQLRDPEWTKKNGTAPSIMDYARFNYVAQPEDGAATMPAIGPYDFFAVNWGYRQFDSECDEKAELNKLVEKQIDNPIYRFGNRNPFLDSTRQTEDLGSNAVEATRLGLKNLERVAGNLIAATARENEEYDLLENMYEQLMAQWNREMGHVVNVIGGVEEINLYFGDAEARYFPNSAEYQRSALEFLIANALQTPELFLDQKVIGKIYPTGAVDMVLNRQVGILNSILNLDRFQRVVLAASHAGDNPFTGVELVQKLTAGLFDAGIETTTPDIYRRNLQRAYVDLLGRLAKEKATDLPGLSRLALEELEDRLENVETDNFGLKAHIKDLQARIEAALDDD